MVLEPSDKPNVHQAAMKVREHLVRSYSVGAYVLSTPQGWGIYIQPRSQFQYVHDQVCFRQDLTLLAIEEAYGVEITATTLFDRRLTSEVLVRGRRG